MTLTLRLTPTTTVAASPAAHHASQRVRGGIAGLMLGLWSASALGYAPAITHGDTLTSVVFIAILATLAAHSVLSYFAIGDRVYLAHALLALSLITTQLLLIGGLLWSQDGALVALGTDHALAAGIAVVGVFASTFTRDFFVTATHAPLCERLLLTTAALFALSLLALWLAPPPLGRYVVWGPSALLAAVSVACALRGVQLQLPGATLFATAVVSIATGSAATWFAAHHEAAHLGIAGAQAGWAVALLLLAIALTRRTDSARSTRALHLAAELDTTSQSLSAARQTETTLLKRLEERALELDALNTRLIERTQGLESLAHRDALTQLPNRLLFEDRTTRAITRAQRHNARTALILIDIEAFRHVNETHGHAIGDAVLAHLAQRLKVRLRAEDTVARVDGDEFALLLEDVFQFEDLERVMTAISDEFALPFVFDDKRLHINAAMGYALYPEDGTDTETLIRSAERRMREVKQTRSENLNLNENRTSTEQT